MTNTESAFRWPTTVRTHPSGHDTTERPAAYLTTLLTRLALDRARTIARRRGPNKAAVAVAH